MPILDTLPRRTPGRHMTAAARVAFAMEHTADAFRALTSAWEKKRRHR